jgi:hypothetical protein
MLPSASSTSTPRARFTNSGCGVFQSRIQCMGTPLSQCAALAAASRADSRCVVRKDSSSRAVSLRSATLSMPGRRA